MAAAPTVERIDALPPRAVSDAVRQALQDKGYRVTLDDGWSAEFWFARPLKLEKKDVPGALYPELSNSEFVGVVKFSQGMSDYRGQSIPPGLYTLRYELLPQDGDHMGVSPNPDFLLASPAADDSRPAQSYPLIKLAALSSRSTSTGHPAVIAMEAPGNPSTVTKNDRGEVVFSVSVPGDSGDEKIGIVIKGSAAQ